MAYYEPSPRFAPFAAAVDGKFYVWGGATKDSSWKSKDFASTVEIFDPVTEVWTSSTVKGESPPLALFDGVSASMDNCLYIYGGCSTRVYNNSPYKLDVHTLEWTILPPLPIGRRDLTNYSMLCHEGTIYLNGNFKDDEDQDRYNLIALYNVKDIKTPYHDCKFVKAIAIYRSNCSFFVFSL